MDKDKQLETLRAKIIADKFLPLIETNLVFGEGSPDCAVMFIGEAPGFHEDRLGRPFVGRAGQLLDTLIKEVGWKREQVYITNVVKRRPPENRDPLPEEIDAYKPYLAEQIKIINPKVIVPLGRFSTNYFLPFAKISRDHGKVFEIEAPPSLPSRREGGASRIIFPLYHPAAALRSTDVFDELKTDFKKLPDVVSGKIAPAEPIVPPIEIKKKELPPQGKLF
jgi:DNA polymerase